MYSKPTKSKPQEKTPFSKSDIVYSKGEDTYVSPGNEVKQLTIAPAKRDAFFKKHPNLLNLLKREAVNPLVQEPQKNNEVQGEYFITPEATALLIERMFRQEKNRILSDGKQFNTKNIFIIDNNPELLEKILAELIIKDNEDAKFIYVNKIHASLLYMRQIQNTIHCFILDSESATANPFSDAIKKIYPSALCTQTYFTLLKDYYSCFTFVLKSLKYFVKHGHEFFPFIYKELNDEIHQDKKIKIEEPDSFSFFELEQLPPPLLKLYQGTDQLSEEILNTIVSVKKNQTLKDYYKEYAFTVNDSKNYNSAALLKKYHYLEILANYLAKCLPQNNMIAADKIENLPKNLHKRILKSSVAPKVQLKNALHPVDKYLKIQEILDSQKDALSPYEKSLIQPIEEKFPDFKNSYYQLTKTHQTHSAANNKIITLLLIAAFAEIHDLGHIKHYLQFAQKLFVLFGEYPYVLNYFRKHADTNAKQPIHDLCLFEMPKESLSNSEFWRRLVLNFGPNATKYLANSAQINQLLENDNYSMENSELDRVARIAANLRYPRSNEHPQLAALCLRFNASSETFAKCLYIIHTQLKSFDFLPDITIPGAVIDSKLNQYTFSKLPVGDLDGFFLGEYTSCCQSIGKAADVAVVHGMTSPYSGFYVIKRNNKIIAQSWVWIAEDNDVVFDSWEFINKHEAHIYKPFILKAAEQFLDYGFRRVLIGTGGNTPKMGLTITDYPAQRPKHNSGYSDAKEQYLIEDHSERSPFTEFAKKHSSYASWITEDLDNDTILEKISEQIVANQLSFAHFINLIRFFHLYQHKILFHTSQAHKSLFQNAIAAYGHLMTPFYKIIIEEGVTVLDLLLSYKDNTLLNNLLSHINESELPISTLMHSFVAHDMPELLMYLYSIRPQAINTNAITAINTPSSPSLLFTAAQYNAQACAFFILSTITKEQLIILMQQTNRYQESIMHYLAINNAVAIYNKIIEQCGADSNFRTLLPEEQTKDPLQILYSAIAANSVDFCRAYNEILPFFSAPTKLIMSAINNYPQKVGLEAFTWLQGQFLNKFSWIKYLQTMTKNDKTVMYTVLDEGHFSLALHLLKDFDDLDDCENLDGLLLGNTYKYPIKMLANYRFNERQELHAFFTKILQIYDRHPDKLIELFCKSNYAAIKAIVASQNIELFHSVLKKFTYKTNSNSPFYNTKYKYETILNAILTDTKELYNTPRMIPLNVMKKFIDALFRYCSKADKEIVLERLDYKIIPGEILEYLLEHIKAKNNRKFLANWAQLDKDCLLNQVMEQINNSDLKFYQVLFEYYINLHSKKSIQTFLLNQWNDLLAKGTIHKNPFLLRTIYSLFAEDKDIVTQLLTEKYESSFKTRAYTFSNYKRLICKWIKEPTKTAQNNMSALLWTILIEMMIMFGNDYNYFEEGISNVLNPMIKVMQNNNSDALSVFKLENSTDLAILTFYLQHDRSDAERVSHAIKLILINCTHGQRLELIKSYHEKLSGRFKEAIMTELETYVAALEKLDILLQLKSELTVLVDTKKTASFFSKISGEHLELCTLLKPFDANEVVYVNSNHQWLYITADEINKAWEKVLSIFNSKIQKNNLSSTAPSEFLGMVLKYQQKMIALDESKAFEPIIRQVSLFKIS